MVVVKFPRGERAVGCDATLNLDDAGGTKIGPGEFFLARPNDFYGTPSSAGQTSGLQRSVAGVLSAIGGTGVRHDHKNAAFGNVEYGSEVVADGERPLGPCPNRQFPVGPLGNGGTRFEGGMRDEGHRVPCFQVTCGGRESFIHRPFLIAMAIAGIARGLFLEIRKEFLVRNLRYFLPFCLNGIDGALRFMLARGGCTNEITVADDHRAWNRFSSTVIAGKEGCAERRRAQDFAVEHSGRAQVRRVLVTAGDKSTSVHLWNRLAGDLPSRRRSDGICCGKILRQGLATRELRVTQRTARGRIDDLRIGGD